MRIALVSSSYVDHKRSVKEHAIEARAIELARLGHEVHVLTTRSPKVRCEINDGVTVHYLEGEPGRWTEMFAHECLVLCRALKPRILHLEDFEPTLPFWLDKQIEAAAVATTLQETLAGWAGTVAMLQKSGKLPDKLKGTILESRLRAEQDAIESFQHVIVTCARDLIRYDSLFPGNKPELIYNPIASRFFRPKSERLHQGFYLLVGSKLTWKYGSRDAEQAAYAVGAGLQVITQSRPEKVPGFMDACKGVIVPSFSQWGLSMSACEALARCRPAICYAPSGACYESKWGLDGIVSVPAGDTGALIEELNKPLPVVHSGAADAFRPEVHATRWLEAMDV